MSKSKTEVKLKLEQELSLERIIASYGVQLEPSDDFLVGECPFHSDDELSLRVTSKDNTWACSQCDSLGGVIEWVEKAEGISKKHAVALLEAGLPIHNEINHIKKSTSPKIKPKASLEYEHSDQQLLSRILDYYHESLKDTTDGLIYLQSRGITSSEAIDYFTLGYANRTLGYRLPQKNRKAGSEIRGHLQRLGLYRTSGHEHFTGSIVFPIYDLKGEMVQIYSRKIIQRLRKGTPDHLYLNDNQDWLWNSNVLTSTDEIILCRSIMDALTLWSLGYRDVVSHCGLSGLSDYHLNLFKENNIQKVTLAYRQTQEDEEIFTVAHTLMSQGIECFNMSLPNGKDVNELVVSVDQPENVIGQCIRHAVWMSEGKEVRTSVKVINTQPQAETLKSGDKSMPSTNSDEIHLDYESRHYRVRGLDKNTSFEKLKVNLLVTQDDLLHVDTLDLYVARQRTQFIKLAAFECRVKEDIIKKDVGKLILHLEAHQEKKLNQPKELSNQFSMTDEEQSQALAYLKDPLLLERLLTDFQRCGIVGEETNKIVSYLACVSRLLDSPLAVVIQSTSAAGKTSLMDAVLAFMPEESREHYSAMTGQSLFYMGNNSLKHKILAIAEEEGANQAAYALKLLQSEGEISIASTGKDTETGRHAVYEYTVEGPIALFFTTTAIDIDEELMNRCLVLTVNEDRNQTREIHKLQRQRRTLEGISSKIRKKAILQLHQNAQRLLKPLAVVNPYAESLTFLDVSTRTRRDHEKYLTLIDSIALLHQYQRPVKSMQINNEVIEYIEVSLKDIEVANLLSHQVLGRTLDNLPPQTRRLLDLIHSYVKEQVKGHNLNKTEVRFTRRLLREALELGDTQLKVHLKRLVEMEYLCIHKGEHGRSYVYECLFDGKASQPEPHMDGLIDVKSLRDPSDNTTMSIGRI